MLGATVAVEPADGKIVAPCDGEVSNIFETGHDVCILVEADLEEIKNAGYQTTTMMILTNTDEFGNVTKAEPAEVKTTSKVMTLIK